MQPGMQIHIDALRITGKDSYNWKVYILILNASDVSFQC